MASFDFEEIRNQIERQERDKIHRFNLMLVGKSKIGKSALVKSLFKGTIEPNDTTQVNQLNVYEKLLEENGVKLQLRCIETSKHKTLKADEYVKYIDEQLKSYFVGSRRELACNIDDPRVHCCLYLIPSYGETHLDEEDIACMRALHEKVNLVPIIARADSLNRQQLILLKENILADLDRNGINYFRFQYDEKEDEERHKLVKIDSERFPFAVVAADEPYYEGEGPGRKVRWIRRTIMSEVCECQRSVLDITNERMCDFAAFARLLVRHCMINLIDSTHEKHYSRFKNDVLEASKRQGGKNLQMMGLKPHEIRRILQVIDPNSRACEAPNALSDKQKTDMERELDILRKRVQILKNRSQSQYAY